jgi:hypothetical protein
MWPDLCQPKLLDERHRTVFSLATNDPSLHSELLDIVNTLAYPCLDLIMSVTPCDQHTPSLLTLPAELHLQIYELVNPIRVVYVQIK